MLDARDMGSFSDLVMPNEGIKDDYNLVTPMHFVVIETNITN